MSEDNQQTSAEYKPVWDNWSIVATAICMIIVVVLIGTALTYEEEWYKWLMIAVALFILSFVFFFPYRTTLIDGKVIKLQFIGYSRQIDLREYRLIASGREYAKGSIRIFASGGHFGYPGYWLLKNGKVFASYLTNFKRNVRFLSNGKRMIALNAPKEWFDDDTEMPNPNNYIHQ